jgi:hypothetical protein
MAMKKVIRFWRGTVENYNFLKRSGALDYWTRYSVKYVDDYGNVTWKEFYGDNQLTEESGQLLPVRDIVENLPSDLKPGDRYWVSKNGKNYIVQINVGKTDNNGMPTFDKQMIEVREGISVRVKNRDYKSYLFCNGEIKTYDEVDCGTYDV